MPNFTDTAGREWSLKFDGLLLKELRDDHGINLADLSGEGYARIELDSAALVEALACLCSEQIKAAGLTVKQFAGAVTGEALDKALAAVWEAAEQFFPLGRLSAIKSNYQSQKEMRQALSMLPPEMQKEMLSGVLPSLGALSGAGGPAANQSKPA